jgi:hypothetical protein
MHGTLDRRVADTAAWVYYIELHSESCIRTVQKTYCFAAGAATDQIMDFITSCGGYGMTSEKKKRPQQ